MQQPKKHLNKKLLLIIFSCCCICNTVKANDSSTINALNKLRFQQVVQQKTPSILDSLKSTYALAKKIKHPIGQAEALKNLGIYYYFKRSFDSALYYYQQGAEILKNEAPNIVGISLHLNTGVVYFEQSKYKEAILQYLEAKNQATLLNDSAMMVKVLNNLANAESTAGNLQQAQQTLQEAVKWSTKNNPALPNIISTQALLYVKIGDTAMAINKYKEALELLKNTTNLKLKANTLNNYGNILLALGNTKEANSLHNEALQIFEQIGDKEGKLTILNQFANTAFKNGDYKKALMLYKQIAEQANDNLLLKKAVYTNLVFTYKKLGDYKNAFESIEILTSVKDSIGSIEIREAFEQLKTENAVHQAELKTEKIAFKAEKEKLTLSKQIAWLTIGLILSLGITGIVLYLRQRQQWKAQQQQLQSIQQKTELEMQLFRTQMNPHFFFNALYSIQNYVLNNNALESSRYLGKFARLTRAILEWNAQPFVLIEKEITILEDYLSLEQLRFEGRFTYTIHCSEEIASNYQIPTMILQPFLENAIIHGLSKISWPGLITITFTENTATNTLQVSIDDNGIGIQPKLPNDDNKEKKSIALELTTKRLQLLSNQFNRNFYFDLINKKELNNDQSGVLVNVYLPLTEA
jgi:tetratricopeptide (TPR) repeat protein